MNAIRKSIFRHLRKHAKDLKSNKLQLKDVWLLLLVGLLIVIYFLIKL